MTKSNQDTSPAKRSPFTQSITFTIAVFLLLAGLFGIISYGNVLIVGDESTIDGILESTTKVDSEGNVTSAMSRENVKTIVQVCAVIGMLLSLFPILGGLLAIQKKNWAMVRIFAIIGLLLGGMLFLTSILSLVSIILIYRFKDQFLS